MTVNRARLLGICCVGMVAAVACAVFPDEALLPGAISVAGSAGEPSLPSSDGAAGHVEVTSTGGVATGGAPVGLVPDAGAGGAGTLNGGGAGGAAPECVQSGQTTVNVAVDLWIDAAKSTVNHGKDVPLFVVGGAAERRAMFQLELPKAELGTTLASATFNVRLASNADASRAPRRLGLHRLSEDLNESKTNWDNYGPGNKAWMSGGGDFLGGRWANLTVPAATDRASLSFDVTAEIRNLQSTSSVSLAMVLLEIGAAPPVPAELAIVAMEGNASQAATLILTYCEP